MRADLSVLILVAWCAAPGAGAGVNAGLGDPPDTVDRDTPSASINGFLNAAHTGHYDLAAHYLYLDHVPRDQQAAEGPRLARRLRYVIDRKLWIDFSNISKEPEGDPTNPKFDQLGVIPLGHTTQPIRVSRVSVGNGQWVWLFSKDTVRSIDKLYEAYGPPLGERLPDGFYRNYLGLEPWQWIGLAVLLALAPVAAFLLDRAVTAFLRKLVAITAARWDDEIITAAHGPLRLLLWAIAILAGTRWLLLPPKVQGAFDLACRMALIASVSWFVIRSLRGLSTHVQTRLSGIPAGAEQSLRMQGVRTQVAVLRRIVSLVVYVLTAALLLLQFEAVRHVGVSLLASAGLAGLVFGFAAQKSLSTLLAGIQLTVTQPIRFGDTVVVEGEAGVVEEITLTYVIVKLWDQRRLLIPMTFFLEKPFQNWTRSGSDLMAAATVRVNRRAPVDEFRAEMLRLLESEGRSLWDGRFPNLMVTEAADKTLILRALVGAVNAGATWELRELLQAGFAELLRAHPEWMPGAWSPPRATGPGPHGAATPPL